ncbi:MAG: hypothetical protein NE328_20210 [Lentisphaeraceae bacterium]|nr:hypothetical protein [Lentisphaeraceae bacterium]
MNLTILINAQQRGLFISTANKFAQEGHKVTIVTKKPGDAQFFRNSFELKDGVELYDPLDFFIDIPEGDELIKKVTEVEKKYKTNFSFLFSLDRGLGRGYLFNVDRYPNRFDSWLSHEDKLKIILREVLLAELIITKFSPQAVFQIDISPIQNIVGEYHKVKNLCILNARCSDNVVLYEDCYMRSSLQDQLLDRYLSNPELLNDYQPGEVTRDAYTAKEHSNSEWGYIGALKNSVKMFYKDFRRLVGLRFKAKKFKYYTPFAWIPSRFRRVSSYHYIKKHSVTPEDLKGAKYVFFALHLEPEIALMALSPEFNNSMECLSWISKALPADYKLVIREHTLSYGVRSKTYYDFLRQIPNIVFADPEVHSWKWIENSDIVSTITGTVGFEGVYYRKPVLSFGKHQIINRLPTVEYANTFETTLSAIKKLNAISGKSEDLEISHKALHKAISDSSFKLPNFTLSFKKKTLQPENAEILYDRITKCIEA